MTEKKSSWWAGSDMRKSWISTLPRRRDTETGEKQAKKAAQPCLPPGWLQAHPVPSWQSCHCVCDLSSCYWTRMLAFVCSICKANLPIFLFDSWTYGFCFLIASLYFFLLSPWSIFYLNKLCPHSYFSGLLTNTFRLATPFLRAASVRAHCLPAPCIAILSNSTS